MPRSPRRRVGRSVGSVHPWMGAEARSERTLYWDLWRDDQRNLRPLPLTLSNNVLPISVPRRLRSKRAVAGGREDSRDHGWRDLATAAPARTQYVPILGWRNSMTDARCIGAGFSNPSSAKFGRRNRKSIVVEAAKSPSRIMSNIQALAEAGLV